MILSLFLPLLAQVGPSVAPGAGGALPQAPIVIPRGSPAKPSATPLRRSQCLDLARNAPAAALVEAEGWLGEARGSAMGEAAGLPMTADAMDAIMAAMAAMAAMVMAGAMAIIQIVAIPRQAMVDTAVELTGTHRCAGMALLVTVAGRAVRSMLRRLLCRSPFMVVGALATVM